MSGGQANFPDWMERTVQLIGREKVQRLQSAHIMVAGLGGVGSMAAEMLARAGVGELTLVDSDVVQPSNINRQVPALHSTIGKSKTEVMSARLQDINPALQVNARQTFLDEASINGLFGSDAEGGSGTDSADKFGTANGKQGSGQQDDSLQPFDFVVDAIDTLTPKLLFIEEVYRLNIPFASSMGSGGKTDPSRIRIDDFGESYNCRLAYLLRKKLRKKGIEKGFRVVFSTELVDKDHLLPAENERNKKSTLGTVPFIPAIFGCMLASVAVEEITKIR